MKRALLIAFALGSLIPSRGHAQEMALGRDAEIGFRAFIGMAQHGELGSDVSNANVSVDGKRVTIELVMTDGSLRRFSIGPKQSAQLLSRYFDIEPAADLARADAQRIGTGLDAAFAHDPFTIVGVEAVPGDDPVPGVLAAWRYGGVGAVARVIERRMMMFRGVGHVMTLFAALTGGVVVTLFVLWGSLPPPR